MPAYPKAKSVIGQKFLVNFLKKIALRTWDPKKRPNMSKYQKK